MAGRFLAGLVSTVVLLTAGAFQGCTGGEGGARSSGELQVELETEPNPPTEGETLLRMHLRDGSGAKVIGATVRVEGNMNHAGMVPEFADAAEVADGTYEGTLTFTMGGDWFLVVTAEVPQGQRLEAIVALHGVRPASDDEVRGR